MFKKRSGRNLRIRRNSSDEDFDEDLGTSVSVLPNNPVKNQKTKSSGSVSSDIASKTAVSFVTGDSDDSDVCENPDWFVQKKTQANERAAAASNQYKFKKREKEKIVKREELVKSDVRTKYCSNEDEKNVRAKEELVLDIKIEPLVMNKAEEADDEAGQYDRVLDRLDRGVIPNAAEIHAARKKRQFARETGFNGYIPLNECADNEIPKNEVRDELSSGDEDERMEMVGKRNDRLQQRITIQETIDDHNEGKSDQSEDENSENEMSKWEKEQLEKVIGKSSMRNLVEKSSGILVQHQPQFHHSHKYDVQGVTEANRASLGYQNQVCMEIKLPELPAVTCDSFLNSLGVRLSSLKATHDKTGEEISSIVRQNLDAENEINSAREQLPQLEIEFKFFQNIRNYINDYIDCMCEKTLIIDKIEQLIQNCYVREADYLSQRRQQEVTDESLEMSLIASSGGFLNPNDVEVNHNQRILERCGRRQRRKMQRMNISNKSNSSNALENYRQSFADLCEGLSSDEELDVAFNQALMEEQSRILNEENLLFEDTVDDFQDIELVMQKLESWKLKYPQSYDNAFVSESLPKLFSPFIKLELLHWNPLKNCQNSLEDFSWFKLLTLFGIRSTEMVEKSYEDDTDSLLVCKIIDRVVLPKVIFFVEKVWNPVSVCQSYNLHSLISQLLMSCPLVNPESKRVQRLVKSILAQFDWGISEACFVPVFSKENVAASLPMRKFLERQFWTCFKLAYSIALFENIISSASLTERFFNGVLNRYLMMALTNMPTDDLLLNQLQKIIEIIPSSWLDTESTSSSCIPELQHFVRFLSQILNGLFSNKSCDLSSENFVSTVLKMLVKVRAINEASDLISKHNLTQFQHLLQ